MKDLYIKFYQAIIDKDANGLNEMLDEHFQIIHINGLIQTKDEFIDSIVSEKLQYDSMDIQSFEESIMDDKAVLIAENKVISNLYQSGKREWRLSEKIAIIKKERWIIYRMIVTCYR